MTMDRFDSSQRTFQLRYLLGTEIEVGMRCVDLVQNLTSLKGKTRARRALRQAQKSYGQACTLMSELPSDIAACFTAPMRNLEDCIRVFSANLYELNPQSPIQRLPAAPAHIRSEYPSPAIR